MATEMTEIKVWQVSKDRGLVPAKDELLESSHLESELEGWIAKNPEILGDDFLVINRQWAIDNDRRLDLLCLDGAGRFVIVELKRDKTPREAVAQALDYASWFNDAGEEEIGDLLDHAEEYLQKSPSEAFTEHFNTAELPELVGPNHRIILAAPRLDSAAERIISYLATRYAVPINAVFFKYSRLISGEEILVRSVLVPDKPTKPPRGYQPTVADLLKAADERMVGTLLEVCRRMNHVWQERPAEAFGSNSFVYLARFADKANPSAPPVERFVFGIDVSGKQLGAPSGQLDVWIAVSKLAEATAVDNATIRETLDKLSPSGDKQELARAVATPPSWQDWGPGRKAGWTRNIDEYFWMRLRTPELAEVLVRQLKEWAGDKNV